MILHQCEPGTRAGMHPVAQRDTTFTKIFVGGLPYHTSNASLRKYFETFGDIEEAVVITDRQTGKSRGYGFVTMTERGAAERACKDANPVIDGRRANVNLAYLGAKPRSMQTGEHARGFSIGIQQIHPTLIQRQQGLTQHYVYPQGFLQPSLMLPSQVSPAGTPYLDYSATYNQYTSSGFEQYPYVASPGFLGYGYTPSPAPLTAGSSQYTLPMLEFPPQQLQSERLQ